MLFNLHKKNLHFLMGSTQNIDETKYTLLRYFDIYKKSSQFLWVLTAVAGLLILSGAKIFSGIYANIRTEQFMLTYHEILFREYHEYLKCDANQNSNPATEYIVFGLILMIGGLLIAIFQPHILRSSRVYDYSEGPRHYNR